MQTFESITVSVATWILSTLFATLVFWTCFKAYVSTPPPEMPQARLVASWDPLACGDPHRVALELEDEDGGKLSTSAPCALGALTVDITHFGVYRGRLYAWDAGAIRSIVPVDMVIDQSIVRWLVET